MRILTVRQPWAWAIVHGQKDVENRVRNLAGDYRGPVAIHAGLRPMRAGDRAWWAAEEAGMDCDIETGDELHSGHIIGVVDLVDVHVCRSHRGSSDVPDCVASGTPLGTICSSWADFQQGATTHHLVLRNPRPLAEPIPYRGALGLRRLDDATARRVIESALTQIGRAR